MQFEYFIDDAINHRTVAGIQEQLAKQSKRNVVSRHLHAKNDKETIAAWRSDLNRILLAFNVRSVFSAWRLLTSHRHPQAELAINIHVAVSDIRQDVLKIREEIGGQVHSVSRNQPPLTLADAYGCLDTSQVREPTTTIASAISRFHLAYPENPHLHHQGPALGVTI